MNTSSKSSSDHVRHLKSALRWCGEKLLSAIKRSFRIVWALGPTLVRVVGVLIILFVLFFSLFHTKRDVAYRYSLPGSDACNTQTGNPTLFVQDKIDNDETVAVRESKDQGAMRKALSCMLQSHSVKSANAEVKNEKCKGNPTLSYYLSFLEFQENGSPAEIDKENNQLKGSQLEALLEHLDNQKEAGKQNFVFVFIHGWRHDARIGDDNVKNTRLMAAHLASFLQQRSENKNYQRYCKVVITAVYVGWRGARLDETRLQNLFGGYFKGAAETISNFLASMTLFDRKPVSERIAPAVISALRQIDTTLHKSTAEHSTAYKIKLSHDRDAEPPSFEEPINWFEKPRLITIGHSLGGNLLAFGLKERMVEIVGRNNGFNLPDEKKTLVKPPFGDLIVLLNPASEAENWFAHQRAFRQRLNAEAESKEVQRAYAVRQPPIYISLTAAHSWPANGILRSDVEAIRAEIGKDVTTPSENAKPNIDGRSDCEIIRTKDSDYKPNYEYDTATFILFPLFRFDFRPFAQALEEWSDPNPYNCSDGDLLVRPNLVTRGLYLAAAAIFRNAPFMNTDVERTRTIGHLDPMRAPFGQLFGNQNDPATWYGTTHELLINFQEKEKLPNGDFLTSAVARYADAASNYRSECAVIDNWLTTVRTNEKYSDRRANGLLVNWDSGFTGSTKQSNLTKIRPRPNNPGQNVESQIRQTLYFSGSRSVTGANDPFWNVRAFDTAMISHNGYVSYPLICALFQFVMDKITDDTTVATKPK